MEVVPERLQDVHIRTLAPFIIGHEAWPTFEGCRVLWDWVGFVEFVENTFALSREACIDAVYELR